MTILDTGKKPQQEDKDHPIANQDDNHQGSEDSSTSNKENKKPSNKSILKKLLSLFMWFLLLLFLLLLLVVFLLSTNFGSKAFVGLSNQHLKVLQVNDLEGNILTDFSAKSIRWQGKAQEKVEVYDVALKNDFSTVLDKRVHITHLYADHLIIHLPDKQKDTNKQQPPTNIELPWSINIDELQINKLELIQGGQQHIINNIRLSAEAANDHLHVKMLVAEPMIENEPLYLSLTGEANINEPYTLAGQFLLDYRHTTYGKAQADINLSGDIHNYQLAGHALLESPKYGDLKLDINGKGTQKDFNIEVLNFSGLEGTAQAEGYIAWQDDMQWDVKITLDNIHTEKLYADSPAILSTQLQSEGKKQGDAISLNLILADLKGQLDDYPLAGNASLRLNANKENVVANIKDLNIKALGGITTFAGDVSIKNTTTFDANNKKNTQQHHFATSFDKNITWDGELTLKNIQANAIIADLPQDLSTQIVTKGDLLNKQVNAQINLKALSGTLKDYPLSAKGQLVAKGALDDLQVTVETLTAKALAGEVSFVGQLNVAQQDIAWDGKLSTKKLQLQRLNESLPKNLSLQLATVGKKENHHIEATLDLDKLEGRLLNAPLKAQGSLKLAGENNDLALTIKALDLTTLNGKAKLSGEASMVEQNIQWQATLDAQQLMLNKINKALPSPLTAVLTTKGQQIIEKNKTKLNADINLAKLLGQYQDYPLEASGVVNINGDPKEQDLQFTLKPLKVKALGGNAMLNGEVGLNEKDLKWQAQLIAEELKTDKLFPEWSANLSGEINSDGQLVDGEPKLKADIVRLTGRFQDYPLKAKGTVFVDNKKIDIDGLSVTSGNNRININGRASEPFNLDWNLEGNNLTQLYKEIKGQLKAQGALKGTLKRPEVQATVNGKNLGYDGYRLKSIDLSILQDNKTFQVDGELEKLVANDQTIKQAHIKGRGQLEKHQINVDIKHKEGELSLTAKGGWRDEQWQGAVNTLDLTKTVVGNWSLDQAVNIVAGKTKATISNFCLQNKKAGLCAKGSWQKSGKATVKGELSNIPFALAKPWLPKTIDLLGTVNADFNLQQVANQPSGTINITLPDNQLRLISESNPAEILRYRDVSLKAHINNRKVGTTFNASIIDRGDITGQAAITLSPEDNNHRIAANVKLAMPTISWLDERIPEIENLKGKINGNIAVNGLITKPTVNGVIKLQNAELDLPETGTSIRQANLSIQAHNTQKATLTGQLRAGEGVLNINGQASLSPKQALQAKIRLQGNRLSFMDTYEIQGFASPDLTISLMDKLVKVDGTLRIPETTVTLNELPPTVNAITESDDVVFVGRRAQQAKFKQRRAVPKGKGELKNSKTQSSTLNIQPNVNIVLGDKVNFSGFGLRTRLAGQIRVIKPKNSVMAQGSLQTVDGTFERFGQALIIERGRLVFNGAPENPGFDIRAVRDTDDVTVGMQVQGTVQKPETRLFSDPVMSQTDVLSYLLTGRSFSESSGDQTGMLLRAVTSLGVAGGESIAQKIGGQLGLDSVSINTGEAGGIQSSELELGKKLGPKLYLKYFVGIFDSAQKLALEYQINKRLRVEAETGQHQGLDFIYRIEKD
ncbi:MAG: translocation/assembly module TamB domain-containing protein [bacterium]